MKLHVFQADREDIFRDMVRVDTSHRPGILAGQVFRVTVNNTTILAIARGAPKNNAAGIWLDDAMRSRLGLQNGTEVDFKFDKARWSDNFLWLWKASDPVNRTAGRLGLISLVLGVTGLVLGIISVFK